MTVESTSLSYVVGKELPGPWKSCIQRLEECASNYANETAVVCAHQPHDLFDIKSQPLDNPEYTNSPYLRWTYREFYALVERLARALAATGVGQGTPVFTFLPNGAEFLIILFASMRLGSSLVPINVRNLANTQEVTHMIKTAFLECPSDAAVVFADSPETAAKLEGFKQLANVQRIITSSEERQQWTAFASVLRSSKSEQPLPDYRSFKQTDTDSIILFTSGTTSLPKGCHWHYPSLAFFIHSREHMGERFAAKNGDAFAAFAPNNHAMGCFLVVLALGTGSCQVFPTANFEPTTFLKIAQAERCTHTIAVPTMVYAMVLAKATQKLKLDHMRTVLLGGAAVTPEVLRLCETELGVAGCEIGYGMTEGPIVFSGRCSAAELTNNNGEVSVGTVLPETRIKICAPGSHEPVPRGEVGELHSKGPTVCTGYIGRDSEEYYDEDGFRWCASGDMARIDEQGRVFIVGRYKEMIIRGGENISPVAVETVIGQQLPHLRDLTTQIVGAADVIAGEVPVAVVAQKPDTETIKEIKDTVVATMGRMYAIDDVIYLGDLSLQDFPRTLAGKVQRMNLKGLVQNYRKQNEHQNGFTNGFTNSRLTDQLISVWARIVGASLSDVSLETQLEDMGDSITMMRVKDRLFKVTGVDLTVGEMLDAKTLGGLLRIIEGRISSTAANDTEGFKAVDTPPTIDDMVHAVDDEEIFDATKRVITKLLKPHGLQWEDVREVMPALDFTEVAAKNGIFSQFTLKGAMLARNTSVKALREAVMKAVANNPMQSSFILWDDAALGDDLALQVTIDQKPDFIEDLIEDKGTLKTVAELKRLTFDMMQVQGTEYPGPLFRAWVVYVEETRCAALIHNIEHTVTDATFGSLFWEDIDLALSGNALKPHVPYKLYCDHTYNTRTSPAARAATKYHVQRLKDLPNHRSHFFPPLDKPMLLEDGKPDGYVHTFSATSLNALMRKHPHLKPSLVLKAATALFLLHTNNYSHAIFSHWDSSRDKFPFTTRSSTLPANAHASDVGGQLINPIMDLISLTPGESKLAFLERLQEEQLLQSKHAAAPLKKIMRGFDAETAELFPHYSTECVYNWLGTNIKGTNAYENLEFVEAVNRRDVHRFYNGASLVRDGKGNDSVVLQIKGSVFTIEEMEGFGRKIEKVAMWLMEDLEQPVEGFRECMQ
ncbi:putative NRPS-like protein biosynthetic cluster [Paraconiothyrium brasiliense]|uniref:NRPS-like protein biosynthetic cluster n=1 Tax=Paraconiothyrium brasiliense TaxID=300254 RepID=A0ABR3S279_9PLEO